MFSSLFGHALGYTREDGLDRAPGRVTDERCQRAVRLDDDVVLLVQLQDGIEMAQNIGVVLDLWRLLG